MEEDVGWGGFLLMVCKQCAWGFLRPSRTEDAFALSGWKKIALPQSKLLVVSACRQMVKKAVHSFDGR